MHKTKIEELANMRNKASRRPKLPGALSVMGVPCQSVRLPNDFREHISKAIGVVTSKHSLSTLLSRDRRLPSGFGTNASKKEQQREKGIEHIGRRIGGWGISLKPIRHTLWGYLLQRAQVTLSSWCDFRKTRSRQAGSKDMGSPPAASSAENFLSQRDRKAGARQVGL